MTVKLKYKQHKIKTKKEWRRLYGTENTFYNFSLVFNLLRKIRSTYFGQMTNNI